MTKTLKTLTATFAALVMALAIGGAKANAGGVHFDFSIGLPVPFGYATVHSSHGPWPYYYRPYYYAPYAYYRPYYGPYYGPAYRYYRYERRVHRDWGGHHDHDRWRDHDRGHDRWRGR